jgi:gliding motility-associated-like protein
MVKLRTLLITGCLVILSASAFSQACTTLGQTPSTAFPVCGTTTFHQSTVPLCSTNDLYVPGCTGDGALYANKNPFFYKFTCYVGGTLGFVITPITDNEDYDWQLWDITGHDPNDIFTDNSLIVTGNWSGSYGTTGASSSGVNYIQCASVPGDNKPRFAQMPVLIVNHTYLLMISHFTDGQSGYDLSFGGGTAVITDPKVPHMVSATPYCDGTTLTLLLNKRFTCTSLTSSGSEFSLSPATRTITSAVSSACTVGFDFDTVKLTLSGALPGGTYDLIINNGTDANTLLDLCGQAIAQGEKITFNYAVPQPILADSIGKAPCSPDSILIYYPKKIRCSSISSAGTDFTVTGPSPVTVISAGGNCVNDETSYIVLHLAAPIYTQGIYNVSIQPGLDGSPVFDVCGQPILAQTLQFATSDTVNADFTFSNQFGCQRDTLTFTHDGAHSVNYWNWSFNGGPPVLAQTHTIIFPASSTNNVQLIVSNGVCSDTTVNTVALDNEVKAKFEMDSFICPEDKLAVTNTSTGLIDAWRWNFDILGTSNLRDPLPFQFPTLGREAYYTVKLTVYNNTLNCSDSTRHTLTVLDHCYIGVPTAFTPNGDGLNDTFWPHNALKAEELEFKVFNRWGQLVFQSKSWRDRWNGKINGVLQDSGVYVWFLSYTHKDTKQKVFEKGTVTLIR